MTSYIAVWAMCAKNIVATHLPLETLRIENARMAAGAGGEEVQVIQSVGMALPGQAGILQPQIARWRARRTADLKTGGPRYPLAWLCRFTTP